jgi:NADP-dependent 3-hydroxy acid dehydrogenase YdfG
MLPRGTFDGKVVAITGGGTGLGKAFGLEFARLGATIAILSRSEAHRLGGVNAIESMGGKAIQVPLDVRNADAVRAAFDSIENMAGPVDIFLNNAAGNFPVPAEDLSPNGFRTVVEIDLQGTFNCSREMARRAISAGRTGAILNMGSPTYHGGGPGLAHAAAAKAGVHNLTYSLAVTEGCVGGQRGRLRRWQYACAAAGKALRIGVGSHVPVLAVRLYGDRLDLRGRRRHVPGAWSAPGAVHARPRTVGARSLHGRDLNHRICIIQIVMDIVH